LAAKEPKQHAMSLIQAQSELTEAAEVRLALDGNVEAFRDFVRPHRRYLYLKALSIVGSEADAEEVAQNAVLKAFTKLSQFRHESQFRTWLISITINEARMWLRSNLKYRHESLDYLNHQDGEDRQVVREFADPRESPFQVLERKQVPSTILKALTLLPSLYTRVFVLRDLQLLSISETAKTLRISENNVKTRLRRGRLQMRRALAHLRANRTSDRDHASNSASRRLRDSSPGWSWLNVESEMESIH
jgi:RNA polymerase sigma-70 factor (ECF subfamily)